MTIHFGMKSERRTKTTCGKPADFERDSTKVHEVNCINCISLLAYPPHNSKVISKKSQLWLEKLKGLQNEN